MMANNYNNRITYIMGKSVNQSIDTVLYPTVHVRNINRSGNSRPSDKTPFTY